MSRKSRTEIPQRSRKAADENEIPFLFDFEDDFKGETDSLATMIASNENLFTSPANVQVGQLTTNLI